MDRSGSTWLHTPFDRLPAAVLGQLAAVPSRRASRSVLIEELTSPLFLRVVGVLDFEPSDAGVVRIGEPLGDNSLEVVSSHKLEELSSPALDGERFGDDLCVRIAF